MSESGCNGLRSRINDMISATQRIGLYAASPGRAFKLAQGGTSPSNCGLGTQERVAVGADRGKPWLEKFLTSLV